MKQKVILGVLILALLLVGCAFVEDPIVESKKVLDEYLSLHNDNSYQEYDYNLGKQIMLTDGNFSTHLSKLKEQSSFISTSLKDFEGNEDVNRLFKRSDESVIKEMIPEKVDSRKVIWTVSRSVEYNGQSDFQKVKYVIVKGKNGWKIIDFIDNDGKSVSENLKAQLNETDQFIISDKKLFSKFFFYAKNDKCFFIQLDDKMSETEKTNEQEVCYSGKYISIVKSKVDTKICDEISTQYYKGLCYGQISIITGDKATCDKMGVEVYDSRGYNDPLSTRDICYGTFSGSPKINYQDRKASCDLIANNQMKQGCLDAVKASG